MHAPRGGGDGGDGALLCEVLAAAAPRLPSLRGAVFASSDLADFTQSQAVGGVTDMVYADDASMAAAALLGATAFASTHFSTVAPLYSKLITAGQKGDAGGIKAYQKLVGRFGRMLGAIVGGGAARRIAATKAIASFRLEHEVGQMRAPGPQLTVQEVQRLRDGMAEFVGEYAAAVKALGGGAAKAINVHAMPGFNGKLDDKIARRIGDVGARIGLRDLSSYFPHLHDARWRHTLPGADCDVAQYIDHTILKTEALEKEVSKLTGEAKKHKFYAVCVNGGRAAQALDELAGTNVNVAAVIGFPLGAGTLKAKAREARELVHMGCGEIDMVMNVGAMKDGDYELVYKDIKAVVDASAPAVVKVIFESCLLTADEVMDASIMSVAAGAHFVKTSTGFNKGGATPEAIDIMLAVVGNEAKVKASGGVRTAPDALAYITAGVARIGTSSGIAIVTGAQSSGGY
jgi:deoxyribose-phosphate aldolase